MSQKRRYSWMEYELQRFKKDIQKPINNQEIIKRKLALRTIQNYFTNYIKENYPDLDRKNMNIEMVEKISIEVLKEISDIRSNINQNIGGIAVIKYLEPYKTLLTNSSIIKEKTKEIEKFGEIQKKEPILEKDEYIDEILTKNHYFLKKMESDIQNYEERKKIFDQYQSGDINKKKSLKNKYPELLNPDILRYIDFLGGSIETRMEKYTYQLAQKNIEHYGNIVKENEIELLQNVHKFIQKTNGIQIYNQRHTNNMNKMTKVKLDYSENSSEDNTGIHDFFSKEELEKLNHENLNSYTIFWINKYVKEMEDIHFALTSLWQFDLFEDIAKGKELEISSEDIKIVKAQVDFLKRVYVKIMDRVKNGQNSDEIADKIDDEFGKKYTEVIYVNNHDQSRLKQDIALTAMTNDAIYNSYEIKSILLTRKIANIKQGKENINYGIIPEASTDRVLCIGLDEKGLNMPLVVHVPISEFIKTFTESNITGELPIYLRNEDFHTIENEHISTNILMPISSAKIENIKKRLKVLAEEKRTDCKEYKFLEHILANQYPKRKPKSLKHTKEMKNINLKNINSELEVESKGSRNE